MDDGQAPLPPATVAATQAPWWRIGRASLNLILDIIEMSRGAGDILDPLILSVIIEANVAPINQKPELQRAYAGATAPPDEIRRPVSVSAVAASLNVPYETVRRRVAQLAANDACQVTRRGVLVTTEMLATPRYMILATSRYERLKRFYFELKAIGVLEGLTPPSPDAAPFAGPPVRLVNRGLGQYMLRVIENILRRLGHPLTGLVLLSMAKANAEHLDAPAKRVEGPIPDSVRRPVPVLALARRLGLPPETVRRHVRSLEAGGYCRRVPGGRLAALEKLDSDEGGPGLPANLANVMRLMDHLSAFGALAYWEAEASRTA